MVCSIMELISEVLSVCTKHFALDENQIAVHIED